MRPAPSGDIAARRNYGLLVGTGVSAAAIWRMREALDDAGLPQLCVSLHHQASAWRSAV